VESCFQLLEEEQVQTRKAVCRRSPVSGNLERQVELLKAPGQARAEDHSWMLSHHLEMRNLVFPNFLGVLGCGQLLHLC
jgi:hypothetical protein